MGTPKNVDVEVVTIMAGGEGRIGQDTAVYLTINQPQDSTIMQSDLDMLQAWEREWEMSFNRSKYQTHMLRIMEDSEEFKWAVKVVIKRQMRDLIEQLRENGEEVAIISADLAGGSCSHFGSPKGEWFISEQRDLTSSFLNFCRNKGRRRKPGLGLAERVSNIISCSNEQSFVDSDQSSRAVYQDIVSTGSTQEGSSKTVLRVSVPDDLADGMTDEEMAGLVGRLFVSKLTNSIETGNSPGKTGTLAKKDSISRTRSGRAMSSSFQSVLDSLKNSSAMDATESKNDIISQLTEISNEDLKRFEVCTEFGTVVDLLCVSVTVQQLEVMSDPIVQALEDGITASKLSDTSQLVRIVVSRHSNGDTIQIELENPSNENTLPNVSEGYANIDLDMEVSDRGEFDDDIDDPEIIEQWKHLIDENAPENETAEPSGITKLHSSPRKALGMRIGTKKKTKVKQNKTKKKLKKKVDCPQCGITLSSVYNLPAHIKQVHLKIKNYVCTICSKAVFTSTALETHMITVHTRQCESCMEYVVESVPWEEGVKANTPREVTCVCGAYVTIMYRKGGKKRNPIMQDEGNNEETIEENTDEDNHVERKSKTLQKYACGVCGRLFASKHDCQRHNMTHSESKNFVCELCGSGFKEKQVLCRHMFKEHGIYTNKCEVCQGNFGSVNALKVHMGKKHPKPTTGIES